MTRKTIKKILSGKLFKWTESITDENVRALVKKDAIVTGGAIASMLMNEDVKDFDIYFRTVETTLAVADYYVKLFNATHEEDIKVLHEDGDRVLIMIKSRGVASAVPEVLDAPFEDAVEELAQTESKTEKPKYVPVFLSSNAITLSDKIQIVVRFSGEPEKIHENYDFVHCTNHYDFGKNELVLRPEALECILAKQLQYQGSKYPLCSIIRTRKFIKRGFNINAGQYLKMMFQLSQLDLTDVDVLEDQLVGVDSAYFGMLIAALRTKLESDPGFKLDNLYLVSIIDRIF